MLAPYWAGPLDGEASSSHLLWETQPVTEATRSISLWLKHMVCEALGLHESRYRKGAGWAAAPS